MYSTLSLYSLTVRKARSNGPCQDFEFRSAQEAMSMTQPAGYKEKPVGENEPPQTRHRDEL